MEGAYRFPLLRVKPAADRPPFRHPRFRGNDGKRDCVETRISKNSFEALYPTLSQFIPYFCTRLVSLGILLGENGKMFGRKKWLDFSRATP